MNLTSTSGPEPASLFAVDWGTSSCRVWSMDACGRILSTARSSRGTLSIAQSVDAGDGAGRVRAFEEELTRLVGDELVANPRVPVLACGMVGSSLGWREAGYIEVPTSIAIHRDSLTHTTTHDRRDVWIIPGLHTGGPGAEGYPDVIRGEETQLIGVLAQLGVTADSPRSIVLPGTHTKWVRVADGSIEGFSTVMTGEFFSLIMNHSILGEPAEPGSGFDSDAFGRGVDLGASPSAGNLMAKVFSARGLGLDRRLAPREVASYISGVLIGDEVARELSLYPSPEEIVLCGSASLTAQYALALDQVGARSCILGEDTTVQGLRAIARSTGLLAAPEALGHSESAPRVAADEERHVTPLGATHSADGTEGKQS